MLSYSHLTAHHMTLCHCCSCNPTIIATIDALSKSDGIQSLKITNLFRYLLFDSSMDPALLAGVNDTDDEDTSFAGVHDEDTSFAGVPVPTTTIATNADDNSDPESNHNSIDPNEADDNSSKPSIHSTRSHLSIHSEDQTKPDNIELPELETQVPILCSSERVSVPPSNYIPWMRGKTYVMNIQTEISQN